MIDKKDLKCRFDNLKLLLDKVLLGFLFFLAKILTCQKLAPFFNLYHSLIIWYFLSIISNVNIVFGITFWQSRLFHQA